MAQVRQAKAKPHTLRHGWGMKIKLDGKIYDVRDLIKQDLRAVKKRDKDEDGKKRINRKD